MLSAQSAFTLCTDRRMRARQLTLRWLQRVTILSLTLNAYTPRCVCGQYDKPDATKRIAFNIRDYLLDEIRTATPRRKWQDAYIIGSYPDRIDRDNFVREYNAELVHIDTPQDACVKRAYEDIKRVAARDAVVGWIADYWRRYNE